MECKFCNENVGTPIFDLGDTAISNNLIGINDLEMETKIYPLVLYVCPKCFLVQISDQIDTVEIFNDEYVYFSSTSVYWLKHAKKYCNQIIKKLNLKRDSFVVEVASNDGYLLKNFVDKKINCLGVEPTGSTAKEAILKGVPTLVDFFNVSKSHDIVQKNKKADLIIANNVLAHVPDINDFVPALKILLNLEGTITIEFPHLLCLVENKEFDTIYHEHFFYFSLYTLVNIFKKHNLCIYDLEALETHGGSLRIYATHQGNDLSKVAGKLNVDKLLAKELGYKINTLEYYKKIKKDAIKIKFNSLSYLIKQKENDKKIIAFGAAAKGNTFLNYCGIKNDIIDFIVDETQFKIGKYMPQSKIPIYDFKKIIETKPDIIIILAWNHKEEILKKLLFTKKWNCNLVIFIPELKIY
jgi:hypothetical protein